ncbi:MAG: ABC transporter substrate-binding protein [Flavobacteriales bacterium]
MAIVRIRKPKIKNEAVKKKNYQNTKQLFFYFLIMFLTLNSCKNPIEIDDSKVFRFNRYDGISSLDPAFAKTQSNIWITNQLFNGLVQLDSQMNIKPSVSKKWIISKDGKTYDFILRKDVFFHQNTVFGKQKTRNVTAYDFVYSFNRLLDKQTVSPGGWVLAHVENFKALNDTVFQIKLNEAFPPFLGLLSMQYCAVVPKEAVEFYGSDFRSNPVGTGPFQFKIWEENVKLVLRKNPLYFEKDSEGKSLPYLEAVSVTFLPDKYSEFLQLIQGNIDFMSGLDPSYKDELVSVTGELNTEYQEKLVLKKQSYLNTEYLCFYLGDDKKLDIRLRQAINYGFDRTKVIQYLRNNIGTPATGGMIPDGLPSYFKKGYDYQPEKAKKLIDLYKKEKGSLPEIQLTTTSDYLNICEYLQAELNKLGLEIQINVTPGATLRDGKANGKFSFFRVSWIADYPDGENYLSLFYSKNQAPNGPNYSHFKNTQFDQWYEKALQETSYDQRRTLYQKMDSLMLSKAPVVPLYYDEVTLFVNKKIQNFKSNPINLLDLKNVWKEK